MNERSFEIKADAVFEFDKKIRFIAVVTREGKAVGEVFRRGVVSLEPESETKMIYTKAGIAIGMTDPMDKYHGRVGSFVMNREKVVMMCFNRDPNIVLISAEPGFEKVGELRRLIEKVGIG